MFSTMSQSGHTAYGLKEFALDTPEDLNNLPIDITPGSIAFIISTGSVHMLNNQSEWVEV